MEVVPKCDLESELKKDDSSPNEDDYVFVSSEEVVPSEVQHQDEAITASPKIPALNPGDPVVIMVAGKVKNGKSTALNNIFGLHLEAKSSSTLLKMECYCYTA